MHYIRFLKPPIYSPSPPILRATITITTDLGESFLNTDIQLRVELEDAHGKSIPGHVLGLWKGTAGMRSLLVQIPTSKTTWRPTKKANGTETVRMVVRPQDASYAVDSFAQILDTLPENGDEDEGYGTGGGVLTVRSMGVELSEQKGVRPEGIAERILTTTTAADGTSTSSQIRIREETGESIARHIWDAGLVLSAYLSCLSLSPTSIPCPPTNDPSVTIKHSKPISSLLRLPIVETLLSGSHASAAAPRKINILELGAGCGVVGLTLASLFSRIVRKVLLTDLDEAMEILGCNITLSLTSPSLSNPASAVPEVAGQVLDWAEPLPVAVREEKWDLVVVADCTYNPDVVPDLVGTLRRVRDVNEGVLVLLAMKVRHESEAVFFDLMAKERFEIVEKGKVSLGLLGGEGEEIEIYVFR